MVEPEWKEFDPRAYAVAVVTLAVTDTLKALLPTDWADDRFGHAWLYMGVFGIIVFMGLALGGVGREQDVRRMTAVVIGSTVLSGLMIVSAAALTGTRGSM